MGDVQPVGKPDCALGSDCADCGTRHLCSLPGTRLQLPYPVLPPTPTSALRLSQILFMVMGSSRHKQRTQRTQRAWCSGEGVRCIFFADTEGPTMGHGYTDLDRAAVERESFPLVRVRAPPPPKSCCVRHGRSASFFCERHRSVTLHAQYRFLPALQLVRSSEAFRAGAFRWFVLVDDDSFVFTRRLRWLLSRLDYLKPLYLGDFGSSGEATQMHIPHFACGGAGSVLSSAALQRMEARHHRPPPPRLALVRTPPPTRSRRVVPSNVQVAGCLRSFHTRCMQSDWMIGGCARRHNVSFLRDLGCGTCDVRRCRVEPAPSSRCLPSAGAAPVSHAPCHRALSYPTCWQPKRIDLRSIYSKLKSDRCFFLQNTDTIASVLPLGAHAPAVVHGLGDQEVSAGHAASTRGICGPGDASVGRTRVCVT